MNPVIVISMRLADIDPVMSMRNVYLLGRKVDVARRIDDVDLRLRVGHRIAPAGRDRRGLDGDAPFTLLRPPIRHHCAFIHLAQGMRVARIKEYTLGRGGLPSVDMGNHVNVANVGEFGCHRLWIRLLLFCYP